MSWRISLFAAGTAAALISAAPAAFADDEDARITAFRAVCVPDRQDFEATIKLVETAGWQAVGGETHPELKSVLDSAAAVPLDPGVKSVLKSFSKQVGGRPIFLIVTHVTLPDAALIGCYIYDFEANAPLNPNLFTAWLGDTPSGVVEEDKNAMAYKWDTPPELSGVLDFYDNYLIEGGAAAADSGFSGLVIKMTSVEPKAN